MNIIHLKAGCSPLLSHIRGVIGSNVALKNIAFNSTQTQPKIPIDEYEKNGFFVVKKLVSEQKLDKYAQRFKKICQEKIKVPLMTVMKDVAIAKSEFLEGEKAM